MAYNEPAGSSVLFSTPFNNKNGITDSYNSASIMPDSTAPISPANCLRSRIEAYALTGGVQLDWYTPGSVQYRDLYCRFWWRTNSQFQGRIVANKMFFIRGPGTNGYFGMFGGPNAGNANFYIAMGINTSGLLDANLYPNTSGGVVTPGQWHMIEAYIKCSTTRTSADGIIRWWVNGALVGNHTGMNYCGPGNEGLYNWTWSETWDGHQDMGRSNTVAWEHWIDELYISTGGTVTPSPSPPTISSFTPTSGPVGTPITIVGTNFDPNPAGNAITINNVSCTTLGAQPTQLNTAVPNNGTSGQVKVVTSAGTALSSTNFTVTAPNPGGGGGGGTGGGAGATTNTFNTDFSGTQGPRWYYLNEDGSQMTYSNGLWSGNQLYKGIWSNGFHPGASTEAVLKYVVPGTGSVRITGTYADVDTGGGNGVICTIKKNGSVVSGGGPFSIANGNTAGNAYDITESVADGDFFTFEVASNGENSYDSTSLNPIVVYTPQSQQEEVITLTLTSMTVTEGNTGLITLTISPTRATDSVITLTSSDETIANVPATITIVANASSVGLNIVAGTPGTATITATLGTSTTTSTVTSVEAPPPPDPEDPVPVSPTLSAYTDFLVAYRWF